LAKRTPVSNLILKIQKMSDESFDALCSQIPLNILDQSSESSQLIMIDGNEVDVTPYEKSPLKESDREESPELFGPKDGSMEANGMEPIGEKSVIESKSSDDLIVMELQAKKRKLEEETFRINQSLCVLSAKKNEEKIRQQKAEAVKRQKLAPEMKAEKLVNETKKLYSEASQAAIQ
jgi:hypothetical protein